MLGFSTTFAQEPLLREGYHYSLDALSVVDQILRFCRENDIRLIAFLPPYPPSIHERMIHEGKYGYLEQATTALFTLFEHYDFSLYNFTDGARIPGQSDRNFIDGLHGSERTYAAVFLEMLEHEPEVLSKYANANHLQNLLAQPYDNPFVVFGEPS